MPPAINVQDADRGQVRETGSGASVMARSIASARAPAGDHQERRERGAWPVVSVRGHTEDPGP